jgi:hypothetical protein
MNAQELAICNPPRDGMVASPPPEGVCHSNRDILRYLFKGMGPGERIAFEEHCAACIECRTLLEGTRRGIDEFFKEDDSEK